MGSARICEVRLLIGKEKTRDFFFFVKHDDANIKLQGLSIQGFCLLYIFSL